MINPRQLARAVTSIANAAVKIKKSFQTPTICLYQTLSSEVCFILALRNCSLYAKYVDAVDGAAAVLPDGNGRVWVQMEIDETKTVSPYYSIGTL